MSGYGCSGVVAVRAPVAGEGWGSGFWVFWFRECVGLDSWNPESRRHVSIWHRELEVWTRRRVEVQRGG